MIVTQDTVSLYFAAAAGATANLRAFDRQGNAVMTMPMPVVPVVTTVFNQANAHINLADPSGGTQAELGRIVIGNVTGNVSIFDRPGPITVRVEAVNP